MSDADYSNIMFSISNGSDSLNTGYNDPDTEVTIGTWYHFVGIRDAGSGTLKIYVNGLLADEDPDIKFGVGLSWE